jgi:hypothetical protein
MERHVGQLNFATCHVIYFVFLFKKIFFLKKKIVGGLATPMEPRGAAKTTHGYDHHTLISTLYMID